MELLTSLVISGENLAFSYQKIYVTGQEKYFIRVKQKGEEIASFEMKKDKRQQWKMVPPIVQKFLEFELELAHEIVKVETDIYPSAEA